MLDRKFIVENAELVTQNCVNRGVKVDVDASCNSKTRRKSLQIEVEELNRQANEVSKSIGKAKDPAEREARKEEGRQLREKTQAVQAEARRAGRRARRDPPADSQPVASRRADRRGRQVEPRTVPRQDAAAEVRLQAAGPRRAGREARPGRFRGRRQRGRPRLLLPQERGRAAGTGLAAIRGRRADARGLHADDHARPGPQRSARRHRLHSPRAGNADLQHREHRPEPGGHGRNHAGRHAGRADRSTPSSCRSSSAASAIASAPRPAPTAGPPAGCTACISSPRSRCSPSRCPSRATPCSNTSATWSAGCSTAWAFPTAWSTRPPATWAARPIASSTWKPGCPAAASSARSPAPATAPTTRPGG